MIVLHIVFNKKVFMFFVLPMAICYFIYSIFPIFIAIGYSMTNFRGMGDYKFVGLSNFIRLFTKDKFIGVSFRNTFQLTLTTLIVLLPLSFLMALSVSKDCLRSSVYKSIFFAPYTIGGIIVGLVWRFTLDPQTGLLNSALRAVGLSSWALNWIGGLTLTPYSVGVIGAWSGAGFCMALWMTGFKTISDDVIEAALIDGATRVQQVFHIIIPLLKETFITIFIFTFTAALKTFDSVYVLTGGGPNHASETIVSYMYSQTFMSRMYGYGMAIAVTEFVVAVGCSLLFMGLMRRRDRV